MSIMRISNMGNTFYCNKESDNSNNNSKSYILSEHEFLNHPIWSSSEFWDEALMIGVKSQLTLQSTTEWDLLEDSILRDVIIRNYLSIILIYNMHIYINDNVFMSLFFRYS